MNELTFDPSYTLTYDDQNNTPSMNLIYDDQNNTPSMNLIYDDQNNTPSMNSYEINNGKIVINII